MKNGFTLAEVLIVLAIIGIVASITLPSLLSNTQDLEYKSQWKKIYAEINQATLLVKSDNGGTLLSLCGSYDHDCVRDEYLKHLNFMRKCNSYEPLDSCWHTTYKLLNSTSKDSVAGIYQWNTDEASRAILNNGAYINIYYWNQDCKDNNWAPDSCGLIKVDTNGEKGPNVVGKDMFGVWILKDRIIPFGAQGDQYQNSPCISGNTEWNNDGVSCSALYLKG